MDYQGAVAKQRREPAPESVEADISQAVAENLSRLRAERGWSLAKLSEASGVSRAMLNQIERRQSVPTINVLWKIATALDHPFAALLERSQPSSTTVLPAARAWSLSSNNGDFVSRALFPLEGPRLTEFYELRLAPGITEQAEAHREGTYENLVVNQGCVVVRVDGAEHRLEAGDAIQFRADVPHAYQNTANEPALAYLVMTYTRSGAA